MRKGYPIKTKNANAMAYDASVAKALWEASEKARNGSATQRVRNGSHGNI
jgi:hypothetical protein